MYDVCDYLLPVFSVSLGVGYYGNREAEKGLDGTLEAAASVTETVGRVYNLVIGYLCVLVCILEVVVDMQTNTSRKNKNSSGDEIANVNFLRRYGTYVLQNTKKENLLRLIN